jgi:hypothetical protein
LEPQAHHSAYGEVIFQTNPGKRLRDWYLRVPGAIEAVDKLPSDANAVLDLAAIAAPLLIAAHHTGSSKLTKLPPHRP